MENNEGKKNCCEGKENCEHGMSCGHGISNCCHNWKKCHMMKKIIVLVLLLVAFCLGTQWGEMRSERWGNDRFERGGMMNWGYGKFQKKNATPLQTSGSGSVTVDVKAAPVAPTPAQ